MANSQQCSHILVNTLDAKIFLNEYIKFDFFCTHLEFVTRGRGRDTNEEAAIGGPDTLDDCIDRLAEGGGVLVHGGRGACRGRAKIITGDN